ncbi:MAG TPA: DUF4233 domain-containing protein [Candidatus Nanopelagicales bacterium]|nr:DUF4233 domain-containing protein [Candidatus Nanopelagicales bacterium]
MKTLGPAILLLEAIVVALAIPVALVLYDGGARAAWVLGILALLLLLGSGYARRPRGVAVGSALQLLVILAGVVVPALALLGLIFLGVWLTAVVYGGKADRAAAARAAAADSAGPDPL